MNLRAIQATVSASLLAALAACGGGGDDDKPANPPAPAPAPAASPLQGFWADDTSANLVTANGELWGFTIEDSTVYLQRGSLGTSGSNLSGSITFYEGTQSVTGSVSGTFVARQSMSGTVTLQGDTSAFQMGFDASYDTPATLSALAGNYALPSGSMSIAANGSASGTTNGCSFSANFSADSGGKNYYRVNVRFGGAPCAMPGASADGVAILAGAALLAGAVSGQSGAVIAAARN